MIDQADAVPADLANQSFNDAYMRMLKESVAETTWPFVGTAPEGGFEGGLHRFYDRLHKCSDVTMAELAEVATEERTILNRSWSATSLPNELLKPSRRTSTTPIR